MYSVKVRTTKADRRFSLARVPKYKQLVILKEMSGCMFPGQTYYIMGASGSGKTTLLNALSGRIKVD